ncbi:MAG: hypothetical protein ACI8ZM_001514 [Crocinitomix sp.]|jgi:hypothetical protein
MKRFILTIILSAFCLIGKSQTPDYFGNMPTWSAESYIGPMIDVDMIGWSDKILYYIADSVTTELHTYYTIKTRVYSTTLGPTDGPEDLDILIPNSFSINVRQEGRKIYFLEDGIDSLFISYELNIGDELTGHFGAINPDEIINNIDSVLVGETYRRTFFTDTIGDLFPDTRLIEGIGHRGGSGGYHFSETDYGEYTVLDLAHYLNCYSENFTPL